jgi:hypothetical protein
MRHRLFTILALVTLSTPATAFGISVGTPPEETSGR